MNTDTQTKLIVAGAAVFITFGATVLAGNIRHTIRKHRKPKPLPGTTKAERIYVTTPDQKK